MIGPTGSVRVMVATRPVDFRPARSPLGRLHRPLLRGRIVRLLADDGTEGVAAPVPEAIRADPFSGVIDVFRAKRADRLKPLFGDGTGGVLVAIGLRPIPWREISEADRRLEDGEARWPRIQDGVMRLSALQLQALFEGLDWRRVHTPAAS